jgi:GGDEF domain-containing protein
LVGYLNKEEALRLIEKLGHLVKDKFNSWKEFGENYSIGRKFWAYSDGPEEAQKLYEKAMSACKEMSDENGGWSKVMWSWSELL